MQIHSRELSSRGLECAFLTPVTSPPDAPLAVLLHGFPDSATTWEAQFSVFRAAGYRPVAPWLRGYSPSSVPSDGRYEPGAYAADIAALHDALEGDERSVIVGHDLGAVVAHAAAAAEPGRWRAAITISVPPLLVLGAAMASFSQLRRSWYTFFFQQEAAGAAVAAPEFLEGLLAEWSPDWDVEPVLEGCREALSSPERIEAALGYYRAGFRPADWDPVLSHFAAGLVTPLSQPWLYLHGRNDGCIGVDVATEVPGAVIVDGAGHFPHREQPEVVNHHVCEFLRGLDG